MTQPATMAEVAEVLGCHQTTISRALRNDPRISSEIRRRIQKACRRMGYRPNPLVSALIASRRRKFPRLFQAHLAYVTRNPLPGRVRPGTYLAEIFEGARTRAARLGYLLEEIPLEEAPPTARGMHRMLKARGVCGAIIGSMPPDSPPVSFPWEHYPAVAVGYGMREPDLYRVATNNHESTYQGVETCRQLGYRRIGFAISSRENARSHGHEIGGYMARQMTLPEDERVPLLMTGSGDTEKFTAWLREHRPDVVLSSYPEILMKVCQRLGWKCPRDIGLVALGNEHPPFFARMERALGGIGSLAAEVLIRRVERNEPGIPEHAGQYLINPLWRNGPSVKKRG